ncbi:MAG TPA: ROK family protein [bacterium]|nr:ROK family protein [bacterium]
MAEGRVIGLDLGGTKLASAVFIKKADGGIEFEKSLENRKYDVIFGGDAELDPAEKSRRIEKAMVEAVRELSGDRKVDAIGVCTAGFVEDGFVREAFNTGMKNYPLRPALKEHTGVNVYLYKDSWAPVFAVRAQEPAIVFSIGTGFGGVSCEPGLVIPLRSYTVRLKPIWIPYLYSNDDPGYAISFSEPLCERLIKAGAQRAGESGDYSGVAEKAVGQAGEFASGLYRRAVEMERVSPSAAMLFVVKIIARKAAEKMRAAEVYADVVGASEFPAFIYECITGGKIKPVDLDGRVSEGDPAAIVSLYIQAEFVGYSLYEMQAERLANGLAPANEIYATGSGYNPVNHPVFCGPIVSAMRDYCAEAGISAGTAEDVRYLDVSEDMTTTLACYGAAVGAASGVES